MSTVSCVDCGRLRVHMSIHSSSNFQFACDQRNASAVRQSTGIQVSYRLGSCGGFNGRNKILYGERYQIVEQFSRRKNLGDSGGVE